MGQFFKFPNSRATVPQTMDPFDLARLRRIGTGAKTHLFVLTVTQLLAIAPLQKVTNPTYVRVRIKQGVGGMQNWVQVTTTAQNPVQTPPSPITYDGYDEMTIPPADAGAGGYLPSVEGEYVLMPGESLYVRKYAAGILWCQVTWRDLEVTP